MARKVFFSFHYQRDIWRVNVVRNHWLLKPDRQTAGFWDASLWEEAKKKGDAAIKRMIDQALHNTSVTAVLIGAQSAGRKYIDYEIEQSYKRGNGLFGVFIHSIKDRSGFTDYQGKNPFDDWFVTNTFGGRTYFSQLYPTYDWKLGNGYHNFSTWVEMAAKNANR